MYDEEGEDEDYTELTDEELKKIYTCMDCGAGLIMNFIWKDGCLVSIAQCRKCSWFTPIELASGKTLWISAK